MSCSKGSENLFLRLIDVGDDFELRVSATSIYDGSFVEGLGYFSEFANGD
jgi:hypothetical protein